jgi:hypothetical protein
MRRFTANDDAERDDGVVAVLDQALRGKRQFEATGNAMKRTRVGGDAARIERAFRAVLEPRREIVVKRCGHDRDAVARTVRQRRFCFFRFHDAEPRRWPIFSRFVSM